MTSPSDAAALVPEGWRARMDKLAPEGGPSGADWCAGLPHLLAELIDRWHLAPSGAPMTGHTALALPVQRETERLVLKVGWPHAESAAEPLALRIWDGQGAVRLVAADPAHGAVLLEALDPDRHLDDAAIDITAACEIIGRLLARLHVPAPHRVRRLSAWASAQVEGLEVAGDLLPRRWVDRARRLAAELTSDPDCDATLLHTDLHFGNVLAGEREPWLAIDPKPMAGHPGLELQPVLRNRVAELGTGSSLRWSVRHRLQVVCEVAGIDRDVARMWTIVASVIQANHAARNGSTAEVTLHLALAKALED